MKVININTSIGSVANPWDLFNRWSTNFGTRKYGLYAYHFSNSQVRLRINHGGNQWNICTVTCADHNAECNITRIRWRHWTSDIDQYGNTSWECTPVGNHFGNTGRRGNKLTLATNDIIRWGREYTGDESINFPNVPFQQFSGNNDQEMEILLSRIYIGDGTYWKTTLAGANSTWEWGYDPGNNNVNFLIVECTTNFTHIHEINLCLQIPNPAYLDCFHDMSSAPSN